MLASRDGKPWLIRPGALNTSKRKKVFDTERPFYIITAMISERAM